MKENTTLLPYRLVDIQEKQFSTFDFHDIEIKEIKQKVGFSFGINPENKVVACRCNYTLLNAEQPFINIQILCFFEIESKYWNEKLQDQEQVIIPTALAMDLASITSSTTRGVLFANTKNTPHQKYPMTIINVAHFIKEDIVLSL